MWSSGSHLVTAALLHQGLRAPPPSPDFCCMPPPQGTSGHNIAHSTEEVSSLEHPWGVEPQGSLQAVEDKAWCNSAQGSICGTVAYGKAVKGSALPHVHKQGITEKYHSDIGFIFYFATFSNN